jgi:hypothetical protein
MQTYTVIWRDDGDDYMFTEVKTNDDPAEVSNIGWVVKAGEIEYAHWDEADRIVALAQLLEGYELLAVVKGELEYVA